MRRELCQEKENGRGFLYGQRMGLEDKRKEKQTLNKKKTELDNVLLLMKIQVRLGRGKIS